MPAALLAALALLTAAPAAAGGSIAAPLWSPDGTKIAWAQAAGAGEDIWEASPDGSHARPLARGVAGLDQFAALPDGSFLYDANVRLFHVGPGGRPVTVARGETFSLDRKADLVAYQTVVDCPTCHGPIEVRSLVSGKAWRLAPTGRNLFPALSPDGRAVAFTRYLASAGGGYERPGGIWIAAAKGGTPVRRSASGLCPQWSPDGSRLAFTDLGGVHIVSRAGGDRGRVLLRNNSLPGCTVAWAPDGRTVAALSAYGRLRIVDVATGTSRPVGPPFTFEFAWSPDGHRLLVTGGASGRACPSLWTVRRDGSALRRLRAC